MVLKNILKATDIKLIVSLLDSLVVEEGIEAASELVREAGTDRLANLVNKGEELRVCYTHPRVLAAIYHVLRSDIHLSSLNSRFALPGEGHQALHVDWHEPVQPGDYHVCNSIWLLDDFTKDNGATRVVPASHKSHSIPKESMPDPAKTHSEQKLLLGEAGTVVVFNSHVWHGGTINTTNRPRRAIHSYWSRRDDPQQTDQKKWITDDTLARLTPVERYLIDV